VNCEWRLADAALAVDDWRRLHQSRIKNQESRIKNQESRIR
jgi:hypothetical protein